MILEFTFFNTNNIFLFKPFGHRPSRFIPQTVTFVNYYLELLFYFFIFWRYYVRYITCIGYFILKVSCDEEQMSL